MDEPSICKENENISRDEILHETAVGKGLLADAHKMLKERGTLIERIVWADRDIDKKESKMAGVCANEESKEICTERTDEFGRIMTPKEEYRMFSHKFHGKRPGKVKEEKRMKRYLLDPKTKQMNASDAPLLAMEKVREARARLRTPLLLLSGFVKPGQTSDPMSGFATVEKDSPAESLTQILEDKEDEHFLGIRSKQKLDSGCMALLPPKKRKIYIHGN